jgi:hypothetical protein
VKLGGVISADIVRRLEHVNAVVRNATHFGGCDFTGANVKSFVHLHAVCGHNFAA